MIGGVVARHTIGVLRAPVVEDPRRGSRVPDWSAAVETPSPGWAVDAGGAGEDAVNREGVSIAYTLRGPFGADVLPTDRVRLLGEVFEVVGGVVRQPGPSPMVSHCIVQLARWEEG